MSDDPFSSAAAPDSTAFNTGAPAVDPSRNYLEDLVGDGKKFKTVEDLARGKAESDAFIASLLREKKEALEELNRRQTVEDLLARMEQKTGNAMTTQSTNQSNGVPSGAPQSDNSVNLDEIKKAIKADLEQEQIAATRRQNLQEVISKLNEAYGNETSAVLARKAQELGVSPEYLKKIAEDSPKLFFATVGQPTPSRDDPFVPPSNRVNTVGIQNAPAYGAHKPMSYYQKLKATNPKEYFSAKVSVQMHKDAIALGKSFFDT